MKEMNIEGHGKEAMVPGFPGKTGLGKRRKEVMGAKFVCQGNGGEKRTKKKTGVK